MFSANAPATRLFKLFGTPVYAQGSFLLLLLLFSFDSLMVGRLDLVFATSVAVFVSVLVHELGHVFAARTNGYGSQVVLWALGGFTVPDRKAQGWRDVWMSAAGPLAGFLLWAIVWFGFMPEFGAERGLRFDVGAMFSPYRVLSLLDPADLTVGHELWATLAWLNFVLTLFNLLPIHPLDGGHIVYELVRMKKRAIEATQISGWIGVVTCVGVAILVVQYAARPLMPLLFLGFLAWSSWNRTQRR